MIEIGLLLGMMMFNAFVIVVLILVIDYAIWLIKMYWKSVDR